MKIIIGLFLTALLASPLLAADTPITIGDTTLAIPAAPGLTPVTPDMTRLDQVLEMFVAPQNKRFISFIPEELIPAVQRGEIPDLARSASVQATREVIDKTISFHDFVQLKEVVRKQNTELVAQAQKQLPDLMNQANQQMENKFNAKPGLIPNGLVALPPHDETDRSLSYSMKLAYSMKDANGQPRQKNGCVTTTFVFARAKLFVLYVNGAEDDLEWTRQTAKAWTTAILAANPSDPATAARPSGFINWNSVLRSALIGGLAGGAVGLVRWLIKKRKPQT